MGAIGLLFLFIVMKLELPGDQGIMKFFVSLANCWGILLIMGLLGYSLVTIPKAHWRTTNLELQMRYLYFQTQIIQEDQETSVANLLDCIIEVLDCIEKSQNTHDEEEIMIYCNKALEFVSQKFIKNCREFLHTEENQMKFQSKIHYTVEDAVNIYLQVKYKYSDVRKSRCEWNIIKKKAFLMEDVLQNYDNPDKIIVSNLRDPYTGYLSQERERWFWYWNTRVKSKLKYAYALFLTIFSILVIIDETRLKIQGFYGIYPNQNTDSSSLLFTSLNFSRVSAPLCFNFLNILNIENAALNKALGNINLVPVLGESFPMYFPLVLIFLVIFNFFDMYDKIASQFGLKTFKYAMNYDNKHIEHGKETLRKKREWELLKVQKKKRNNMCIRDSFNIENPDKTSIYMKLIESQDSLNIE